MTKTVNKNLSSGDGGEEMVGLGSGGGLEVGGIQWVVGSREGLGSRSLVMGFLGAIG